MQEMRDRYDSCSKRTGTLTLSGTVAAETPDEGGKALCKTLTEQKENGEAAGSVSLSAAFYDKRLQAAGK